MGGFNSKESEDDLPRTSDPPRFIGISSGPFFYSSEPWPTTTETFTTTISVSPSTSLEIDPNAKRDEVPTVITWKGGGKEVFITGSFNGWKEKIPLSKSEHDFTIIQNLPPGVHQYKFIVDGKWRHATDQPIATDVAGNINNCIEVRRETDELQTRVLSSSPPGEYSQNTPEEDYAKEPPAIPPYLLRALLNTAPSTDDPAVLPLPHHVMINHLYSLYSVDPKNKPQDYRILGTTSRYKAKFVTTVFYKPLSEPSPQVMDIS
eukprot:TRINITY_DN4056_c0_g1_i1.p1 TRINITY_DN4056_c0_g1~~TRINITY_DN4056_c0_g1_i1.p1  ORF type:complete len:262 (-),score=62.72 TRINITY_DN4056_c0_g1_i1:123-908(-)